jgi:hypothetical protein
MLCAVYSSPPAEASDRDSAGRASGWLLRKSWAGRNGSRISTSNQGALGFDLGGVFRADQSEGRGKGIAGGQGLRRAVGPIRQDRPQFGMDL